ncbi:Plasmodium exported protein (Pm-fam-a like), unknown function, partial [Plasmodium malariae]
MELKIKSNLFINIVMFILLTWISHFYSDVSIFNYPLEQKNKICKKSDIRNYRILARYKQGIGSNAVGLKGKIPNNKEYENNKQSHVCPSINVGGHDRSNESKSSVNYRRNAYNKKRLVDKIYYINKVRNSVNLDIENLRRSVHNKYILFFAFCAMLAPLAMILSYYLRNKESLIPLFSDAIVSVSE